jgi:demethylmenaquinone methyltransferase/2-methoxy-6-polyprenyl-1,4-benzoquinol methylase
MAQKPKKSKRSKNRTQNFYDRIADVHDLMMKINGYRDSVAKFLRSLDLKIDSDSYVLDAGSGTGIITKGLYKAGFRPRKTIALDLSHKSLIVSRDQFKKDKKIPEKNIAPVQGNILQLPFPDETFELILTCGVLEYVSLNKGLNELSRVLKKGGKLVLIPVKPSFVGSVLKILYSFKIHPITSVRKIAQKQFKIIGDHEFPITEPIGWSKKIFLLEKK